MIHRSKLQMLPTAFWHVPNQSYRLSPENKRPEQKYQESMEPGTKANQDNKITAVSASVQFGASIRNSTSALITMHNTHRDKNTKGPTGPRNHNGFPVWILDQGKHVTDARRAAAKITVKVTDGGSIAHRTLPLRRYSVSGMCRQQKGR